MGHGVRDRRARYGGGYDAAHDAAERIQQLAECSPNANSILELGIFEGGHTVCLARLQDVRRVVAIEGRQENVERARFVVNLLELTNIEFIIGDLQHFDLAALDDFDAVFNCGLLYHLPEPWALLRQIADVTERMYLSTHYCLDVAATVTAGGASTTPSASRKRVPCFKDLMGQRSVLS